MRRVSLFLLSALVAFGAAELLLRLLLPEPLALGMYTTGGLHVPDERFGFRFTPNYHGAFYHDDGVWNVPFNLDEYGMRPLVEGRKWGPRKDVVVIGGASMLMGDGVADDQTVCAQLARFSSWHLRIRTVAWAGFDLYSSWQVFRVLLSDEPPPDVALLCVYSDTAKDYIGLPADICDHPKAAVDTQPYFRFRNDMVFPCSGPVMDFLGPVALRSYLAYRLIRLLDLSIETEHKGVNRIRELAAQRMRRTRALGAADTHAAFRQGQANFTRLLKHIRDADVFRNTKVAVVFVPRAPRRTVSRDYYDELAVCVPPDMPCFDLHKAVWGRWKEYDFIADGHYSVTQSEAIGRELAHAVDRFLERWERKVRPAPEVP